MRQVPLKNIQKLKAFSCYGLVGHGRLAKHLSYYLKLLNLPYITWSRSSKADIDKTFRDCSHILLPITDCEIEPFIKSYQNFLYNKLCIHFSGALFTPLAIGAHPLMTFAQEPYNEEIYKQIHFVIDSKHPFKEVLYGFPNSHSTISPSQKAKYHALCVISGNFSSILWQVVFKEMKSFGISKSHLLPYLQQTFTNIAHLEDSLTGPLQRNDEQTIKANLEALKDNNALYDIYRSFMKLKELK